MKKIIYILLFGALITSCKKEATVWESDWSAPIVNDTLTLADLVNDSTLTEASNFYELDLTRTLFEFDINEIVSIPDTTINEPITNGAVDNWTIVAGQSAIPIGVETTEEHELLLDDIQLKKIKLKSGKIKIRLENPISINADLIIDLPGFTKNGVPFSQTHPVVSGTIPSPGVSEQEIDISGYEIDLTGESGVDFNKFMTDFDVIAHAGQPSVNFGNEHTLQLDATFSGLEISYARGYFGSRVISDTTEVNLKELDVYESGLVDLSSLALGFEIENGIKVGAQGTLHSVMNENIQGAVVSLTGGGIGNAFNIDPATGTWNTLTPSTNTLSFTSANSNIEAYLENLGMKHTIGYSFMLNPWGNTSGSWDEIYPHSKFKVKLHAQMPLALGMDDLILKDTFDIDLNQDPAKTRIVSGELILNTSNAFPFSADVSLMLLDANGNLLHTVNGTELIEAAQFGSYDAAHDMNVANSNVQFALSDEVIADIDDVKKVVVRSNFNSINPMTSTSEQMIIPIGAFLSVKLKTRFKSENRF